MALASPDTIVPEFSTPQLILVGLWVVYSLAWIIWAFWSSR
jgi:hypothetical protein